MQVPTLQQHEELAQQVAALQTALQNLNNQLQQMPQPQTWVIASEARKCFIGRGGQQIERHTFNAMVKRWLKEGKLAEGKNYMHDGTNHFIALEFLAGRPAPKHKLVVTHLKATA